MKKWKWMALVMAATLCIGSASAHPGRTDANGGHYNHSTGEYHYHHGYPAHQHIDGCVHMTTMTELAGIPERVPEVLPGVPPMADHTITET